MNAFLTRLSTAAASALVVAASATAQSTVDMTGWQTWGGITATANSSTTVTIPGSATGVSAFAYASLSYEALGGSYCSELRMRVEIPGSTTQFIVLSPTGAPLDPGFYSDAGPGTLAGGAAFAIPAGTTELKVFVYESFNDGGDAVQDAEISTGTLTITYGAPPPPPPGCGEAAPVNVGSTPFTTAGGATGQLVATNADGTFTSTIYGPQWFSFTPTVTSNYEISVCGSVGDTKIAIGPDCPQAETVPMATLGYNDDSCACSSGCAGNYSSRLNLSNTGFPLLTPLQAGTTYRILVGGFGTATGSVSGDLVISTIDPPPPANTCANPLEAVVGANTISLDPIGESLFVDCAFDFNPISKPGYARFVAPATGLYAADTCAGTVDTVMAAMTTCGDIGSIIACNDDDCGLRSKVIFQANQGDTVFIAVGLWSTTAAPPASGIVLTIAEIEDPCDNATDAVVGDNQLATDPNAANLDLTGFCDPGTFGDDVVARATYLRFVAPETRPYRVGTCAGQDDTRIAVLSTCGDASSVIGCDDDNCGTPDDDLWASTMVFEATAGTTYFIAVGAYQEPGFTAPLPPEIVVNITTDVDPPPPFDPCAPENIGTAVLGNNTVTPNAQYPALDVTGSPCFFEFAPQAIARAKYLRFTANATGTYLFEQCGDTGTTVDVRMGLMTACGDASSFLICDDDGCTGGTAPFTSRFEYDLTAGQQVFLVVGGYSAAQTGPFNVLITGPGAGGCIPDLNNDGFVNADDLGILLSQWGPCSGCSADFDQNGFVNGEDLGQMLNAWGACP
jgi:hypothetical protein